MGLRYVIFRLGYTFATKSGLMILKFPIQSKQIDVPGVKEWKKTTRDHFFFSGKGDLKIPTSIVEQEKLAANVLEINNMNFSFFYSKSIHVGNRINWHKNYLTNYEYPIHQHWSKVNDLSSEAGDIKFVWELSRFTFLYDFIRLDKHSNGDNSNKVIAFMLDWIDKNPLNEGPNYKCSQEISLRILNWTFALYFYRDSEVLTDNVFEKIASSIYNQYLHVQGNIKFSQIAVRNNHAITETMCLWLVPYLFPFFLVTKSRQAKAKKWFEKEIDFQIFEDGSYLQYSHNYHRVVVQLLTWGIELGAKNNDPVSNSCIKKAEKTLLFLLANQSSSGSLSNYGSNDGALFFPLNSKGYENFSPQLQALGNVLGYRCYEENFEDKYWYGTDEKIQKTINHSTGLHLFEDEGYGIIKEENELTFLPCCKNTKRPFQADLLHLDLWYNGHNILMDSGSYLYNADAEVVGKFVGTSAHNSLTINGKDQMERVGRFIWKDWAACSNITSDETDTHYSFFAEMSGFKNIRKGIKHGRLVVKTKNKPEWKIVDTLKGTTPEDEIKLHWHVNADIAEHVLLQTYNEEKAEVNYEESVCEVSRYYGSKQKATLWTATTKSNVLTTTITIKQ